LETKSLNTDDWKRSNEFGEDSLNPGSEKDESFLEKLTDNSSILLHSFRIVATCTLDNFVPWTCNDVRDDETPEIS